MRLRIDASSIKPGHAAGVEVFTYGLAAGLAEAAPELDLEVEVLRGTQSDWRKQVTDATGALFGGDDGSANRRPLGQPTAAARTSPARRVKSGTARFQQRTQPGARKDPPSSADLTFYPFPLVPASAQPSVIVLHDLRWLKPENRDSGYAAVIRKNVSAAAAIVVSLGRIPSSRPWPPFPRRSDKLVLIPPPTFNARPPHAPANREADLLLYPSSTAQHKNHAPLLDAMAMLPAFRLVCPGPLVEPQASALLARAGLPDLGGRVSFPGFVSVEELNDLLQPRYGGGGAFHLGGR